MVNINMPGSGEGEIVTPDVEAVAKDTPDPQMELLRRSSVLLNKEVVLKQNEEELGVVEKKKNERMSQIEASLEGGEYPEPTNVLAQVLDRQSRIVSGAESICVQKVNDEYYIGKDEDHLKFNIGLGIKPSRGQVFYRVAESNLALSESALSDCKTQYEKFRAKQAQQDKKEEQPSSKKGWLESLFKRARNN